MAKKTNSATVVVRCCLPQDLTFTLPGGRKLTIKGAPVSKLVGLDVNKLRFCRFCYTRW